MERNIFDTVREDAVREARAGDPNVTSLAANAGTVTPTAGSAIAVTFPGPDGQTVGPFVVDETPVDDPNAYMM